MLQPRPTSFFYLVLFTFLLVGSDASRGLGFGFRFGEDPANLWPRRGRRVGFRNRGAAAASRLRFVFAVELDEPVGFRRPSDVGVVERSPRRTVRDGRPLAVAVRRQRARKTATRDSIRLSVRLYGASRETRARGEHDDDLTSVDHSAASPFSSLWYCRVRGTLGTIRSGKRRTCEETSTVGGRP